jgi:hypothetical protein
MLFVDSSTRARGFMRLKRSLRLALSTMKFRPKRNSSHSHSQGTRPRLPNFPSDSLPT